MMALAEADISAAFRCKEAKMTRLGMGALDLVCRRKTSMMHKNFGNCTL